MDFAWTEEDRSYRQRIRDFLKRELPSNWGDISRHGPGSREQTEFSLAFCPKLAEAGMLVPHWPVEWGGANHSAWEHFILGEEMWAAGEPRGAQYMNVNWIGPTLMRFGSDEQKRRYISEMAAGKAIVDERLLEDLVPRRDKIRQRVSNKHAHSPSHTPHQAKQTAFFLQAWERVKDNSRESNTPDNQ